MLEKKEDIHETRGREKERKEKRGKEKERKRVART